MGSSKTETPAVGLKCYLMALLDFELVKLGSVYAFQNYLQSLGFTHIYTLYMMLGNIHRQTMKEYSKQSKIAQGN